ncbi:hypothetical protein H6G33_35765 [Calothrix sp. FACHB-1219]|uniref:hypothetical protein n=1 Tax=unclassified Calothrix TaxID=2619626 RepID=UPI00168317AF|nr:MULTISPECIES: hypothetical protein [unclassified Calothrix]MBD2207650.1 hypothetical protein [Calothrix sp. FACHB-168]MBD2222291.1 hypothetical protein [Calothrix sp. FACHB-1219]
MDNFKIAFLAKHQVDQDAMRGAVLVTDKETKPLEFRVTEPVRPTKIQRTLYGEILYDYILVELIAIPLLKALQEKPNIVMIEETLLMDINKKQEIPAIQILKEEDITYKTNSIQEITSSKFPTLRITTIKELEEKLIDAKKHLEQMYASRDLLEPFQRIYNTCEQIKA